MDETKLGIACETIRQWLSDMPIEEFCEKSHLRISRFEAERILLEGFEKLLIDYKRLLDRYDTIKVYESAGLKFIEEIEEKLPKTED